MADDPKQLTFTTIGGEVVTAQQRGKHYVQPRGYFYHPGTGPQGETCGTCKHITDGRRWHKCGLNRGPVAAAATSLCDPRPASIGRRCQAVDTLVCKPDPAWLHRPPDS